MDDFDAIPRGDGDEGESDNSVDDKVRAVLYFLAIYTILYFLVNG